MVVYGALAAIAGAAVWRALQVLSEKGMQITAFGWLVMGAASGVTFGLAFLLMGLMFFSARNGYDERPPADHDL